MASNTAYQTVKGNSVGRSVHDLSYTHKFNCDMGQLIPAMVKHMEPNDRFRIGNRIIVRFQPLNAPILHEINVFMHYFFVPYRLLWKKDQAETDGWEVFYTGGDDGTLEPVLPRWTPSTADNGQFTLWDYFGFPINTIPNGVLPVIFPRDAYNLIYDEYYRDENLQEKVDLTDAATAGAIKYRAWEKDYFTSTLEFQQKGTPIGFVAGDGQALWPDFSTAGATDYMTSDDLGGGVFVPSDQRTKSTLENNTIDLSAFGFDVADLRLAFQVQRFMELSARAGTRYIEFLKAHHKISPTDLTLQRPAYIGGTKAPVIISEVLQTGIGLDTSTTQLGSYVGHGITVDSNYAGEWKAEEPGLVMGIMSVMPRPDYYQGVDREWLQETRYDYWFPEFRNLSEQAVTVGELYATDDPAINTKLLGYQGRYNFMRGSQNKVTAQMRPNSPVSLSYWHLSRDFGSEPGLNEDLIKCVPSKRIFQVQDEPGLIVEVGNVIKAIRPIPVNAEPGWIDH